MVGTVYKIENHCLDCTSQGLHCVGSTCDYRNVVVYYCDRCGAEIPFDEVSEEHSEDLCSACHEWENREEDEDEQRISKSPQSL